MRSRTGLYIAGPMTGIKDSNIPAFRAAEKHLREIGWDEIYNPADNEVPEGESWINYIYMGLDMLLKCDKVYMLRDWEKSKGARLEHEVATTLKMLISYEESDPFVKPYVVEWENGE